MIKEENTISIPISINPKNENEKNDNEINEEFNKKYNSLSYYNNSSLSINYKNQNNSKSF